MTHMRTVVSIMVSLVLITGLVSASGQGEAPAMEAESGETVTVRVLTPRWASTGDVRVERQVAFQSVIDSFEAAHPNVQVEEVISSASSYDVDVANQIQDGTVEVVWINNPFYPTLQQQGAFADLEPHLSQEDLDDFFPWTIEALKSVNGELGGLWHNTDVRLFFYREDLISDPPTTLSGLRDDLEDVREDNPDITAPYFLSLGHTDAMFHMYGNFLAMGGEVLADSGRPILLEGDNLDIWVEIFESYGALVEDGFVPESAAAARESGVVPFLLSEDVASFVGNSNYGVREINPKLPEEEAALWQATPVLGYEGHPTGRGLSGGWVYSARKIDDNPTLQQAAIDFVIHATGFSAMRQTTKAGGWTPTRESVFTSDTFFSEDRFMAATAEALENSSVRPLVPVSSIFSQVVSDALSRYITGNDAAREVLEGANEELQTEYENL